MSRHIRRIERSRKANDIRAWDRYHQALSTYQVVLPDEPATITNLDADHAVANEREAIAVWLENNILGAMPLDLIAAIRNGQHHANTPPAARKRGLGA